MSSSMSGGVHPLHEFHSRRGTFHIVRPPIPLHAHDAGIKGEISFDDEFVYMCVRDNLWGRVPLQMEWDAVPDLGPLPVAIPPMSELGGRQAPPLPPPTLVPALVMLFEALRLLTRRAARWATAWIV